MSDVSIFVLVLILDLILMFITVYFIITLSDLECDYINALTCCQKLNKYVLPELILKLIPSVIFLFSGYWVLVLLNAPFDAWYILRIVKKPSSYVGFYDPAEIHNRGELKVHIRNSMIKLGQHLLFFFVYLYYLIVTLIG
ncbi:unnamed protein product [Brachionus calyciflorus]|uniref:Cornichon n=1 Tax=Brachionus calyciflorus TaxID=104777 RepID=A0A813TLM1_9BILA|nr:unnamed protein product [Brachionus calyciflorus]